jgi:signal transduction histidine kinase
MRREAAEISDRDLGRRLGVPATRDEVAALGATINALLARLQEAVARERGFVADAGHELRTPLAILRAELELAARPGRSRAALVEAIHQAGEETDRLIRLAEDLLLLARADNHQPFLRPRRLGVPDLLHAAARGAEARAAEREVTVAVHVPEVLDVEADPDRLRQAVDNLLDNATRHSPRGGVVELSARVARPGLLTIEVNDRGPGFPADFLPHAIDRFHRAGDARSRDDGGTGLGLSIVRAIMRAHGGDAAARNRPGGGAAVRIELPATVSVMQARP